MTHISCSLEEAMLVYSERGFRGFFAGCTCRAAWMGLGGFIFLGSFELAKTPGLVGVLGQSAFVHHAAQCVAVKNMPSHFFCPVECCLDLEASELKISCPGKAWFLRRRTAPGSSRRRVRRRPIQRRRVSRNLSINQVFKSILTGARHASATDGRS